MIIVEENTTATIKMFLRDFSDAEISGDSLVDQYTKRVEKDSGDVYSQSCISVAMYGFEVEIISEDNRLEVSDSIISGTFDDFHRILTFDINTLALDSEEFYVIRVYKQGKSKLLSQDKMYIMPSGSEVATYQPKLATTEKTMNNEFKIYGE